MKDLNEVQMEMDRVIASLQESTKDRPYMTVGLLTEILQKLDPGYSDDESEPDRLQRQYQGQLAGLIAVIANRLALGRW